MWTQDVIHHFESQAKVARFLGISRSAVSQWGEAVPEVSARKLEKLTDGTLTVNKLLYQKGNQVAA